MMKTMILMTILIRMTMMLMMMLITMLMMILMLIRVIWVLSGRGSRGVTASCALPNCDLDHYKDDQYDHHHDYKDDH